MRTDTVILGPVELVYSCYTHTCGYELLVRISRIPGDLVKTPTTFPVPTIARDFRKQQQRNKCHVDDRALLELSTVGSSIVGLR